MVCVKLDISSWQKNEAILAKNRLSGDNHQESGLAYTDDLWLFLVRIEENYINTSSGMKTEINFSFFFQVI